MGNATSLIADNRASGFLEEKSFKFLFRRNNDAHSVLDQVLDDEQTAIHRAGASVVSEWELIG
jgi:hypothetical protein